MGGFVKQVRTFLSRLVSSLAYFLRPFAMTLSPSYTYYHSHLIFAYRLTLQDPSSKRWNEVPDSIAREKVGQQIRETLAKMNPMKCEFRKVQRKTKIKRARLSATQSASTMLMSFASSASSSAVSFSSAGEEMPGSGTFDWGNNDAIDTDDNTPLQVDYSTLNSNSNNSISISPLLPPPSPPKISDSPIPFVQSSKVLHKDMQVSQLIPDWQNQQGQEQDRNYYCEI
jgi:hypothetical protein